MADTSWTDLIGQALNAGVGYVQGQMQLKQAKKLAKIQAAGSAGFPTLGTGNMSFYGGYGRANPIMSFGAPSAMPVDYQLPAQPGNPLGDLGAMLGIGSGDVGASCSLYRPGNAAAARPQRIVMQANPVTGKLGFWRYVGGPVEFQGDRTIAKNYLKRHRGRRPR